MARRKVETRGAPSGNEGEPKPLKKIYKPDERLPRRHLTRMTDDERRAIAMRLDLKDDPEYHDQRRRACPYCLGSATLYSLGGDRAGVWKLTCANCSSVSYLNSYIGRDMYRAWWDAIASDPVEVQRLLSLMSGHIKTGFDLAAKPSE